MNTDTFRQKLEDEKQRLLSELKEVGQVNPDNPDDWEATPGDTGQESDTNDSADQVEEYQERSAIENTLEKRMREVTEALMRIENGTYGSCTAGGSPHEIEQDRLDANPAALVCITHMKQR